MNNQLALLFALWCFVYEMADNTRQTSQRERARPPPIYQPGNQSPVREEWVKKALEGYARAQEKKWQRWHEAMFERSD